MCVLGQAGRGRDRADGGAHLGGRQQDHHGQARAEHQHPQEPLHRAPDNHPGQSSNILCNVMFTIWIFPGAHTNCLREGNLSDQFGKEENPSC